MTAPLGAPEGSDERPHQRASGAADHSGSLREPPPLSAPEVVGATCPYLTSVGGSWRQATPTREHRCGALDPPAPQPTDKQRRHCLSTDHVDCSIYRASQAARAATLSSIGDIAAIAAIDGARRPFARPAPILLEQPRLIDQAIRLPFDRGPGQLALVALMILAFAVVAITRLSEGSAPPISSSAPSLIAVASPTPTIAATPTIEPSASLVASPAASFRTLYTVKKGDTLSSIASRFKTTATAIRRLNNLTSTTIHTGQVLKIP